MRKLKALVAAACLVGCFSGGAEAATWTSGSSIGYVVSAGSHHINSTLIDGWLIVHYPGIGNVRHSCNFTSPGVVSNNACHLELYVTNYCPSSQTVVAQSVGTGGAIETYRQSNCGENELGACVVTGGYWIESTNYAGEMKAYITSVGLLPTSTCDE
jgi:hypothetical protein